MSPKQNIMKDSYVAFVKPQEQVRRLIAGPNVYIMNV